jgi:transcriptional regulator of arginine metabolism
MKAQRQAAILDLVARERVSSQEALRQRLLGQGFDVTQATLSRDIKEIGLVKRASDGAYRRPDGEAARPEAAESTLRRTTREFLRSCEPVQNLVVLKTDSGRAMTLAVDIDRAGLRDIVGTIGGDDTILVIARDPEAAQLVAAKFRAWSQLGA